jgi:hypothetical protein
MKLAKPIVGHFSNRFKVRSTISSTAIELGYGDLRDSHTIEKMPYLETHLETPDLEMPHLDNLA